ncbi:MAG: C40 family peptidase [Deltaproteobacteria bacterium]|nr:C40 family peptidase [Deltaproteobacteria bacterium]
MLCTLALAGCATTGRSGRPTGSLQRILDTATSLLGQSKVTVNKRPYRADCSGFVKAAFSPTNVQLISASAKGASGTELIYQTLRERRRLRGPGSIRPGDLLFFHNTWDRNKNRLRDDQFTHVALVSQVEPDGTVSYFHYASGRVKRGVMNLRHRDEARDPDTGKTWNSPLRVGGGRVLAGQLFFRVGRPLDR